MLEFIDVHAGVVSFSFFKFNKCGFFQDSSFFLALNFLNHLVLQRLLSYLSIHACFFATDVYVHTSVSLEYGLIFSYNYELF